LSGTVGEFFGSSGRRIRDVVWGDVPVDRAVRTLLDTGAMGRLRGMSQLGFSFAAFPRARHTRFDHAVGVYHLTRRWIEHTEVAKVLRNEWDVESHNVYRLVSRGSDPPRSLTPTEHLLRDILFGSLDVDALDCLVRDAKGVQVPYGLVNVESLIERLRIVGQENRAILTVDEDGLGSLQAFVFSRYLMHYNVYGHQALRIPTVMFRRAVQDAVQAGTVTFDKLSEQDDAGAFVLIQDQAEPESSTAGLMKRLAERKPYHLALEFDERHPSYASLIRLRDDSSWRRRVEEAWARYLTRYRKGIAGTFDILIDLPTERGLPVGLRLIRRTPLPGERNPVSWQDISGMTEDDLQRYHAPLHRILIATADEELAKSVRRHAEELFTIAEEVG
jgi:HD superfamily phosphohydrolase